ncbi:MAG: neutral zinc metallopeptidase [Acidimicrobiales bacterium]
MLALALLGACATEAASPPAGVDFQGDELDPSDDLGDEIDEPIAPDTGLNGDEAPTSDQVVEAAITDVEAFWQRTYEDVYGEPYQPISGGFWAYGPESEQPPCGTPPPSYAEIAENAFYCPSDDLVAWDDVNLIPQLYDEFGGFTLGIVFAHELGHAIQTRAGTAGPTVLLELQADCFAGAWSRDVEQGNSEFFELTVQDLDKAVAGFLELRDGVGVAAGDPAAHGTGFDRIGSFVDGYEQGAGFCATYPDRLESGDLVVVEVPFTDPDDFERGGNLPLSELLPSLTEDLDNFWSLLFQERGEEWTSVDVVRVDPDTDVVECGEDTYRGASLVNASFYCVASDTIYIDEVHLIPTLDEIGDYAVATEIARQYAFAAQERLGIDDSTLATNLNADCLTGVYASSGFLGNRQDRGQALFLSPGDLDEAVIAFLLHSDANEDVDADDGDVSVGTAFERFDAYRDGFLSGTDACDALLGD